MTKKLNPILICDVESTCWSGDPPPGETNEIIEIGIAVFDTKELKTASSESILVRPARSQVSPFCTELTSLTQEMVDKGVSFAEACKLLRGKYDSRNFAWASYGDYDRTMFEKMCGPSWPEELRGQYPFSRTHCNLKHLFALYRGLSSEIGLAEALHSIGVPFKGRHHRGVDDAVAIANLLTYLMRRLRS